MDYKRQLLTGSIFYFIASVFAAIVAYFTKLVLVNYLSVEDYGLFFAVFTFVLFFSVFRSLGLNSGLARFIAEYNIKGKNSDIKSIISGAFLIYLYNIFFSIFKFNLLYFSVISIISMSCFFSILKYLIPSINMLI
jgi:O-antigen/teichoic acid export membrane protein